MKIICVGYFDKNSRFFLDIKRHLNNTTIRIYSVYFSGFLYTLFRFKFSCWLPLKAWVLVQRKKKYYKQIINNSITYKNIEYDNYLNFHLIIDKTIPKKHLQLQALAYIDIFEKILNDYTPNVLLTIGDSRLCFEIAVAVAKIKNIKIFYLEQGPYNTTFFDEKGVNKNLSARLNFRFNKNSTTSLKLFQSNQKTIKYKRALIYRGLDFLLKLVFESSYIYPPDIKKTDIYSYKRKINSIKTNNLKSTNQLLLILQVPIDVNMIYHSPYFKTHYEMITYVSENVPKDYHLVIREHPLYINKYEQKLYDIIKKNKFIIENTIPLADAMDKSSCVLVINSTVGIEAIIRNKPVIVLGDAFYDNQFVCYKYDKSVPLNDLIINAISKKVDIDCIKQFQNHLFNTVLIEGAIDEKILRAPKIIAKKIIQLDSTSKKA